MLSPAVFSSLGIPEADLPYLNLERDWGIVELPDSTPDYPSFSVHGCVTCRPWAKNATERIVWTSDPKDRPAAIGDETIRLLLANSKMTVKEAIERSQSHELCDNNCIDENGMTKVKDARQWRLFTVVIADNVLDAIAAHSLLVAYNRRRFIERRKTNLADAGNDKADTPTVDNTPIGDYIHFAVLSSPTRFDKPVKRLLATANTLIAAPGSDFQACQRAFAICSRNAQVLFLSTPSFSTPVSDGSPIGITSLYDFVTRYRLTPDEHAKYSHSKASMLFNMLAGALTIDPFLKSESIDKKTGEVKDYNYQVQIRSTWLLMQSRGYVRVVDPTQPDKVGRYYKVAGHIIDEVNRESLMAECLQVLTDYARAKARIGTQDFAKMTQAIRTAKTLNAASAVDLPVIILDNLAGCNRHLDHFFFQNGALRMEILPDGQHSIRLVSYDDLDFFVKKPKILPWEFDFSAALGEVWKKEKGEGKNESMTSFVIPARPQQGNPDFSFFPFPFSLYENPDYIARRQQLQDDLASRRISPKEHARLSRELYDWARTNRYCYIPDDPDWRNWWPFLKVIRCYANEEWEAEEELEYAGLHFNPEQEAFLYGRMKNILGTLGRIVFRWRNPNYIHYLMENAVSSEGKAQGGSGKSRFVRTFVSCVRNVLNVDSKIFSNRNDIETSVVFNGYRPDYHDAVHIEDYERGISRFYNYVTGDFLFRKFHSNETVIRASEAPSIVISSNYAVKDGLDDSSAGRLNLCGFSHYFHRENENLNIMERGFDVVMPDFQKQPEDLTPRDRSQIILVCALAVLFCMETNEKVLAPAKNLKERNLRTALTASFYDWAVEFFSHPYNIGVPINWYDIFEDYKQVAQASESVKEKISPKAFTDRLRTYCEQNDMVYMPDQLLTTSTDRKKGGLTMKCWSRKELFNDPKIWGVERYREIRIMETCRKVVCFWKADDFPATRDEMLLRFATYYEAPDPDPILNSDGQPVTVTEKELAEWEDYTKRRQGKDNYTINQERLQAQYNAAPSYAQAPVAAPAPSSSFAAPAPSPSASAYPQQPPANQGTIFGAPMPDDLPF